MNRDAMAEDTTGFKIVFTLVVSGIECITAIPGNSFITAIRGAKEARDKILPVGDCNSVDAEFFQALATALDHARKYLHYTILGHL